MTAQSKKSPPGTVGYGYCTPTQDKTPQKMVVFPKRVIPIIFLPGIMGSNLRNTSVRQRESGGKNNVAWRPDRISDTLGLINASPARRQLQLDPRATEVDSYDPQKTQTGDPGESSAKRHEIPFFHLTLNAGPDTPLLVDDRLGTPNFKWKEQKAMERGWSEILFSSYGQILQHCEEMMNSSRSWTLQQILNTDPAKWGASSKTPMEPITTDEFSRITKDCWFPVHAMGYNWLMSNRDSARIVSARIRALIKKYAEQYQCEKVILMTHSMGGLLARALLHPGMGNLDSVVLGVVHGVMPAAGAAAAYKRMRAGTDEGLLGASISARVLGNFGSEVTAVLGNAQGGLELLPNREYGNGWLQIVQNGMLVKSLPANNDPYNEIYQLRTEWYRLIRAEWVNPQRGPGASIERTSELIRLAGSFHDAISQTCHRVSYAHYSAEAERLSWEKVVWNLDKNYRDISIANLFILADDEQGKFKLRRSTAADRVGADAAAPREPFNTGLSSFDVKIGSNNGPGDQTVPLRSAEQQLLSGKFKGIFRQAGYEHQNSYKDWQATYSTIYSLLRIAGTMEWSKCPP